MSGRKSSKPCGECGFYLPITVDQSRTVEACLDSEKWPVKVIHEITLAVRVAMMKCGVCGWRCVLVGSNDVRGCEHWWRDE